MHNLGHDSFWFDEVLTVMAARDGIQSAMSQVHHPPLHYVFVLATMKLFGENEFAARLSSAFIGTLTLPLLMIWGAAVRAVASWLVGGISFSVVALSLALFSRSASLCLAHIFSLAAYIFLYLAGERRQWRWWIFFSLATVLNLYTHYAALVVLASQAILMGGWVVAQWRRLGYRALVYPSVSAILVFILYIPGMARLLFALTYNLGSNAIRGGENIDGAAAWLRKGLFEIGTSSAILPYVMAVLALIGLLVLIRSGRWWLLALIVGGYFTDFPDFYV
ncbi:MAG: glycosyltransferase family 39 protein [Chloroflexi bacterium]|nr:glycosyltransferase family 39 protein [Chloroflexota bacterium]